MWVTLRLKLPLRPGLPLLPCQQVAVTEGAPATSPAHVNRLLLSTVGTLALYLPALHGFSSRASVFKLSQHVFAVSEGQFRSVIRTTGSSRAPSPPPPSRAQLYSSGDLPTSTRGESPVLQEGTSGNYVSFLLDRTSTSVSKFAQK